MTKAKRAWSATWYWSVEDLFLLVLLNASIDSWASLMKYAHVTAHWLQRLFFRAEVDGDHIVRARIWHAMDSLFRERRAVRR